MVMGSVMLSEMSFQSKRFSLDISKMGGWKNGNQPASSMNLGYTFPINIFNTKEKHYLEMAFCWTKLLILIIYWPLHLVLNTCTLWITSCSIMNAYHAMMDKNSIQVLNYLMIIGILTIMPYSRYVTVSPSLFHIGDIVEVQLLFVVFPIWEGQYTLRFVLRGITLLDGHFTMVTFTLYIHFLTMTQIASIEQMQCEIKILNVHSTLKREVGYEDKSKTTAKGTDDKDATTL